MRSSHINSTIIPPPPVGYSILIDPEGMTQDGDLKWCPIHIRWEPVNMDHDGSIIEGDFAPIRAYHYIARHQDNIKPVSRGKKHFARLLNGIEVPQRRTPRETHYGLKLNRETENGKPTRRRRRKIPL